jgi:hypothetical protein
MQGQMEFSFETRCFEIQRIPGWQLQIASDVFKTNCLAERATASNLEPRRWIQDGDLSPLRARCKSRIHSRVMPFKTPQLFVHIRTPFRR